MVFGKTDTQTVEERDKVIYDKMLLDLNKFWQADTDDHKAVLSKPDWFLRFKGLAEKLDNELLYLKVSGTPEAARLFMQIYDDLTGSLSANVFQLQALTALSQRYVRNENNFQHFINAAAPTFDLYGSTNPFFLASEMFSLIEEPIALSTSDPRSITRLTQEESAFRSTQKPTNVGYYFLKRRNWLTNYLLAVRFYRTFFSLAPLVGIYKGFMENTPVLEQPPVDPDSVSTDIPYPVMTPPGSAPGWDSLLTLNNMGN